MLWEHADHGDVLVLGLPRGGVPVAAAIAGALDAELDVLVVRKVGVPGWEELAMGAVAMGGVRVHNEDVLSELPPGMFDVVAEREMEVVERRVRAYRGGRPLPAIRGRTVILVDDGLATGSTMRAAVRAVRALEPKRVIVAVPVAPPRTIRKLAREADEVVCPFTPEDFLAIGQFYEDFSQVSDEQVKWLLSRAQSQDDRETRVDEVEVEIGFVALAGVLAVPVAARGIVLFAHGSGSGRMSPRNQLVACRLNDAGFATLLFDLLTPEEEAVDAVTRALRFDIDLLADRLTGTVDWVTEQDSLRSLPIGLFGASTGAAAALIAAARRPGIVGAVVSRGGRPDLAREHLAEVRAPALLIVGGEDHPVIELNRDAGRWINAPVMVRIVPGATHLFEEPGKLEEVARYAGEWFDAHLSMGWADRMREPIPLGGL
jgi:predicted phosphoribosyltransferase/dienelactone hydrolase